MDRQISLEFIHQAGQPAGALASVAPLGTIGEFQFL